jgi:ankyrin repeat protein
MGADVNQATPNGETPLAIALLQDNLAVVQCLVIELGADVNPPQAMPHGLTPLIALASKGHLADVRCLVELGAEVEAVDYYGYTALLASACCGQFGTIRYLLEEAGANLDDVNYDGNTIWGLLVLHFKAAAENGFEEDEEYLAALI